MSKPNCWRDTGKSVKFFVFDVRVVLAFFLVLLHARWWTFYLAVGTFLFFGLLDRFGMPLIVAWRAFICWIAGGIRYSVGWWERPEKKL